MPSSSRSFLFPIPEARSILGESIVPALRIISLLQTSFLAVSLIIILTALAQSPSISIEVTVAWVRIVRFGLERMGSTKAV